MGSMSVQPAIDQLVAKLRVLMPELEARFHVRHVALFGSYVHAEQTPGSDLDVLVSFGEVPSLLKFIELEDFLSDSLAIKVDLVMEEALKPNIGRRIRKDLVPV
jgi:predicted nucleotidyltransferase